MTAPNAQLRATGASAPHSFAGFRRVHAGTPVVVCGCGPSLNDLVAPERYITIGVNDVGRLFDPTYLVVVNPRSQFKAERFQFVETSNARVLFTQLDLGRVRPPVVRFKLGRYAATDIGGDVLHYTQNSPYVAVCLAAHMGASRIGLIGVDFTEHHFFARTGRHALANRLGEIDAQYGRLGAALGKAGIELVNLSETSSLTSLPRVTLASFTDSAQKRAAAEPTPASALRIVSYATTPVAGVPAILARCISERTSHRARCVWATDGYGNGVKFAGDVEWQREPSQAHELLREADVVIVHNGKVAPEHAAIIGGKPVVTMAHNYLWNVEQRYVRLGFPGIVVGQYQATLQEFSGWAAVPNPVPFWEKEFQPDPKPEVVTICYTPSGKHERYPAGHSLYWHAKGYETTTAALRRLAKRHPIRIETISDRQISHAESLAMKRRAHIVIDECVTGSYHRNSLEGLAAGCVVVNALSPEVEAVLRRCAPEASDVPFVRCSLAQLEKTLEALIVRGASSLQEEGRRNREWLERHWDFRAQWGRHWMPAIGQAMERGQRAAPAPMSPRPRVAANALLSLVVPHGGRERLRNLTTTVTLLTQCASVGEIIISEFGAQPIAHELAMRLRCKYVFTQSDGSFERARALNAGSALAELDLIVWCDNDLILSDELLTRAAEEMRTRALDYLIPYADIAYLSEKDTEQVTAGTRGPAECAPSNVLRGGVHVVGGAGIVRREFVLRYGGMLELFRGWGGEDNAWRHKVATLGRLGVTNHRPQRAYHLFHPSARANPHYAANVSLLTQVCSLRNARAFLQQYPPPAKFSTPWRTGARIAFFADPTDAAGTARARRAAAMLESLFGTTVTWASAESVPECDVVVAFVSDPRCAMRHTANPPRTIVAPEDAEGTALVGPLSLALKTEREMLPVWVYWEGECPDWIRACQRTIAAHAPDFRLLDAAGFDRLRDRDRDIALERLGPAQRADFVRAFLLAHSGGLWIDADCIVVKPLAPLLAMLHETDFIAHRDRQGYYPNGFMGACKGSKLARELYDRICATLRSGRKLGWIDLGGGPLTEILRATTVPFHELPCEQIQPVCWSQPEVFFNTANTMAHARAYNEQAYCYMLSNTEIQKYRKRFPEQQLLADGTFFRYVLARAEQPAEGPPVQASAPAPLPIETPRRLPAETFTFVARACAQLQPRSVQQLGDSELWSELLRESCEEAPRRIAADIEKPPCPQEIRSDLALVALDALESADLDAIAEWIQRAFGAMSYVLVVGRRAPHLAQRFAQQTVRRGPGSAALLLSFDDPRTLRRGSAARSVFERIFEQNRALPMESVSGPGSSLAQTAELRQRLSLLLPDLGVRTLLDAPCGDFNWMQHASLSLDRYVGVDIVPAIIERNRARFASHAREFHCADLIADPLPRADLILCRDVLVHFSFLDACRALANFQRSGATYLLTTTFPGEPANHDIATGGWRPLNLERAPFGFPAPLRIINEKCTEEGGRYSHKSLGLWRLADIPCLTEGDSS